MNPEPRDVLDLAMEVGCGMLGHGASVSSAIRAARHTMRAFDLAEYHADVTGNMIIVSVRARPDTDPITAMRVVPIGFQDFGRITQLQRVAENAGLRSLEDSASRVDAILRRPGRWGGYDLSVGFGVVSGAAVLMLGSPLILGPLAVISAFCVHRVQVWLAERRVSVFFQQCVGGALAALVAGLVAMVKSTGVTWLVGVDPGLIVIGAIISMLAGLAILGAAEDVIAGLYVTGTAHGISGLIVTIGLVLGPSVVVAGATWLGLDVGMDSGFSTRGLGPVSIAWAGLVAAAWAFCTRASQRALVSAGLIGALIWGLFLWLSGKGWPTVGASGIAALVIGVTSALASQALRVQLDSISTAAVVPVLPGILTWQGVRKLALGSGNLSFLDGQQDLMTAAAVGIVLAAGVAAGAALARPMSVPIRKLPWPVRPIGGRSARGR